MPPQTTKPPYLSKTLWVNAILAVCAFFPGAEAFTMSHPQLIVGLLAGVNFGLRFLTKDQISLGP